MEEDAVSLLIVELEGFNCSLIYSLLSTLLITSVETVGLK
jgi:hypothetical protein